MLNWTEQKRGAVLSVSCVDSPVVGVAFHYICSRLGLRVVQDESIITSYGHMRWQVLFKSHIHYSYPVIYLLLVGRCPEHVPHVFNLAVFGQAVLIVFSVTSGGRLAVLIYFIPIPANSIFPCDNSPLSCLNSSCPLESCSRVCIRSRLVNFMYTRLLCPSI